MKTAIFITLAVVVIVGVILAVYFLLPGAKLDGEKEEFVPTTDAEFIAQALAEKYNKKINEVTVKINKQIGDHVIGGVNFAPGGQGEGGLLLAAKVDGNWIIVYDGNGSIMCAQVDPYDFPIEMVNECVDEQGNQIIKDKIFGVMDNLITATGLNFSETKDDVLEWRAQEDDEQIIKKIDGKSFEIANLIDEQYQSIKQFLIAFGFKEDLNNAADGPTGSLSGYEKGGVICLVTGEWEKSEPDKKQVEVKCGLLEDEIKIETLDTTKGKEFSISLESNPTTGYTWEADFDKDYIELINKEYLADETEAEIVGAGGEDKFTFKALKARETEISFSYLRSWEEGIAPIEKTIYQVTIK